MKIPNHIKTIVVFLSILIGGIGGFVITKISFSLDNIALMDNLALDSLDDIPVFFTFSISFLVICFIVSTAFAYVIYITDKYNL